MSIQSTPHKSKPLRFNFRSLRIYFCLVAIFISLQNITFAQSIDSFLEDFTPFSPSLTVSASYSPISFEAWGTIQNAQMLFLSSNFHHHQIRNGSFNVDISSGIIFAGWLRYPFDGIDGPRENRYGLGFVPLDLSIPILSGDSYPFFTTSFGFMVMNRSFPNELGATLNYLLDAGLGYRYRLNENNSIEFGYKLHHLSNGNTSIENPGIDSHMIFFNFFFHL